MDDQIQALVNLLPKGWHTTIIVFIMALPFIGRAWHAITTSGGLKGIWTALLFGTNVPKQPASPVDQHQGVFDRPPDPPK